MALDLTGIVGGSLGSVVKSIVGSFKLDPEKKAEFQAAIDEHAAQFKLEELKLAGRMQEVISNEVIAQIELNKVDAAGSWYQAGWRPSAGYVCVIGLLYQFLLQPLCAWASGIWAFPPPPPLDMGSLIGLLSGMLGISGLRTTEKLKDKA